MEKKTIVSATCPRLGERFNGLTKGFKGYKDGHHISTNIVIEMDILERWVKTKTGSKYYYERWDPRNHEFLGDDEFCAFCGKDKESHS
ncbi:hypothetical protein SHOU24_46 [Vibrio phage SHOU24]|uniref:hypothetical protein n=1 Tax=Vibrio phage SHOU24 TaxID=1414739 RepID=UPI0003ED1E71|nr:hypothetical protein SHOU24_46 [Vibrio phage SHOU24]AHI61243.1 hypothetical protein SHOU24_46 [Vibrio phage SHOU24]